LYALVFYPIRTTYSTNLILLDLIIPIISGVEYKLWISSPLKLPITPFFLV
jgi:hypothetical protein